MKFTIKCMGGQEMKLFTDTLESAKETLKDEAYKYGWADLISNGKYLYSAISNQTNLDVKLIKHENKEVSK